MALQGTLKDFGIADILQLIGQQQKSGTLRLRNKDQVVEVAFRGGNILRAKSTTRKKRELIGEMLVRADLLTEKELEHALQTQRRTLQRLGDILVEAGTVPQPKVERLIRLQTTETLYGLFTWKSGSYEFEQGEVATELDDPPPLRAEAVLMEGFRMVDEWPAIRKQITSYQMTFEKVKDLPLPNLAGTQVDQALESAMGESFDDLEGPADPLAIERQVFSLVTPGREVRRVIDLSCLGEFETCKALHTLVAQGYLRALPPRGKSEQLRRHQAGWIDWVNTALGRVLLTVLVLVALGLVVSQLDLGTLRLARFPTSHYAEPAAQRFIARHQLGRIRAALDVYRLEEGQVPDSLSALVEAGLLNPGDLTYPWREPYYYRRTDGGAFILLPPLR